MLNTAVLDIRAKEKRRRASRVWIEWFCRNARATKEKIHRTQSLYWGVAVSFFFFISLYILLLFYTIFFSVRCVVIFFLGGTYIIAFVISLSLSLSLSSSFRSGFNIICIDILWFCFFCAFFSGMIDEDYFFHFRRVFFIRVHLCKRISISFYCVWSVECDCIWFNIALHNSRFLLLSFFLPR